MKGIVYKKEGNKGNLPLIQILLDYALIPARSGIFGFIAFFAFLIFSKYLGYLIGSLQSFSIHFEDVTLSLLGFALMFLIKFLENFKDDDSSDIF